MAHYVLPDVGREHIDALVDRWKSQGLLRDGSTLFDDREVWTRANLAEFKRRFLDEDQYGVAGTFLEKLAHQLSDATDEVRILACELLIVYFLVVWWQAYGDRCSFSTHHTRCV